MTHVIDTIQVCSDCLQIIVNGDYTALDYHYSPEESEKRIIEIESGIRELIHSYEKYNPEYKNFHVVAGNLYNYNEFSKCRCEICNNLPGARYELNILAEVNKNYVCIDKDGKKIFEPLNQYKYNDNPNCR